MMRVVLAAWLLATAAWQAGDARSQAYPSKPIRIIIPAGPGDSCDVLTRLIAPKLSEHLGQPVSIDNRAGAGGQLGLQLIAKAPADGYTLACGQGGNMVIVPLSHKKVAYDTLKDFTPIAVYASNFTALVVHPSVPFRNVKDLVSYARANPGKLAFGSNGEGAFIHFSTEMLRSQAGFTYLHVPYKQVAQIYNEILAGRIDAVIASFVSLYPYVKSGRLRLLGIARATRAPNYPDLPTIAETLPGYASGGWFGLIGPAGMPREVVTALNAAVNRAMHLPDVNGKLVDFGLEVHNDPPEYFTEIIKRDFEKWGKVVRDIGFKPR